MQAVISLGNNSSRYRVSLSEYAGPIFYVGLQKRASLHREKNFTSTADWAHPSRGINCVKTDINTLRGNSIVVNNQNCQVVLNLLVC